MSDAPNASADRRRQQAQDRRRKRADLNRHYLEEEALRALDAGTLRELSIDLRFPARQLLHDVARWLGINPTETINQSIHFSASVVEDSLITLNDLETLVDRNSEFKGMFLLKPTPRTVQILLKSDHQDAGRIYATSGILLLYESLSAARHDPRGLARAESWMLF